MTRLRLTWSEILLVCVAASLSVAAILHVATSPQYTIVMLLAAAAIAALVHERATTRRVLAELATQLADEHTLHKFDTLGSLGAEAVDHALNRIIQRTRESAVAAARITTSIAHHPILSDMPVQVAVLSVGVRGEHGTSWSVEHAARLTEAARLALSATMEQPRVLPQGDGTLLIVFGGSGDQPTAGSLSHALETARALGVDPHLRFGLGVGPARHCVLPNNEAALIGAPMDDASRLQRMAASWHEFHLLCAEPVALLARGHTNQRTTLKLTSACLPPLPVYALELPAPTVAMSA